MNLSNLLVTGLGRGSVVIPVPDAALTDWFGRRGRAEVLVRARTVADVSATVRMCAQAGAVVVPVGGNTGLVGGTICVDSRTTVMLDLTRLTDCQIDPVAGTALVQAGVTIADLHRAAAEHGWTYGVDLASRDSATVGGTVATNAGGIHVCAYGTTREQVVGLQYVMADGTVVEDLRGLPKDNTGYALGDLVVGSEGTLAIVTAARVTLRRRPRGRLVIAAGVARMSDAVALGHALRRHLPMLACEVVDRVAWQRSAGDLALRDPLPAARGSARYVAVVELDGPAAGSTVADAIALLSPELIDLPDCVLATDSRERSAVWQLREGQAEWWAMIARRSAAGELHKFDVTLPLASLDSSVDELMGVVDRDPRVKHAGVFGHVFEGSLHIQLVAVGADDLDERILRLVSDLGGSLSAEHGIGRDKAAWLPLRRSGAEIAAMKAVKDAWDPAGILNPGVIFDR